MIIPPNSEFILLKNVPLDSNYNHTIEFDSKQIQEAYFRSKAFYSFGSESGSGISSDETFAFIRNSTAVKVPLPIATASICNYVMYRNTLYYNKWFYAFVNKVEYISDNTTKLELELDVMQTYHFDYNMKEVFIDRMHEPDDSNVNIIEEGLETGPLYCQHSDIGGINEYGQVVMLATTVDLTKNDLPAIDGQITEGVYSGCKLVYYETTDEGIALLNSHLAKLTTSNKADAIVALYMMPKRLMNTKNARFNVDFNKNFGTYVPVNNKLTRYPYNFFTISNGEGQEGTFKYEYFNNPETHTATFAFAATVSPPAAVSVYPLYYNGIPENIDERITITNFPQCAYSIDSFAAYLALNQNQLVYSAGYNVGMGVTNAITGNLAGAANNFMNVFGQVAQIRDHATLPPQMRGNYATDTMYAAKKKDFIIKQFRVAPEYAFIIDQYFSMYGYKQNKVALPNKKARPYYTYIKTVNMSVYGEIPQEYVVKIDSIFDNGITFWRNTGDIIGNYGLARANNPHTLWPSTGG